MNNNYIAFKKATSTKAAAYIGMLGEVLNNVDHKRLHILDGVNPGGMVVPNMDDLDTKAGVGHSHNLSSLGGGLNPTQIPLVTLSERGAMSPQDKAKLEAVSGGVAPNLSVSKTTTDNTIVNSVGSNAILTVASETVAGLLGANDKVKLNALEIIGVTDLTQSGDENNITLKSSTGSDTTVKSATTTKAGLLGAVDKAKLDGIASGAEQNVATNLSVTTGTTTATIASSTGTDAILVSATTGVAGLMSAADKTLLNKVSSGSTEFVEFNASAGIIKSSPGIASVSRLSTGRFRVTTRSSNGGGAGVSAIANRVGEAISVDYVYINTTAVDVYFKYVPCGDCRMTLFNPTRASVIIST